MIEGLGSKGRSDPEARLAHRKLESYARDEFAHVAFGAGEPLALDADLIVFHVPDLSLPDKEVLLSEHLSKQLLPEHVFGQALLYLVAAVSRWVIFRDPGRFGVALFDEAWALAASLQGRDLLLESVRDGRKHNAAVWIASQHPGDVKDRQLLELLENRFLFAMPSGGGEEGLGFLGMDPVPAWVDLVEDRLQPAGAGGGAPGGTRCLWRDVRGRIGLVEVLAAPESVAWAFETNPARAGLAPTGTGA